MHYLFCAMLLFVAEDSQRWPAFLGMGSGPALSAETLPLAWSPEEHIAWAASIPGDGQSSPIIWGDRVFVTSVEGPMKDKYHTQAFRLSDGARLWTHTIENSAPVKSDVYVSRAAPTPATDGRGLYLFFESGDVLALSLEGKVLWQKSLGKEYGPLVGNHGLAASPLLTKEAVILLVDHQGPSYLLARRKEDGSVLWKTDRTSRTSWSSPTCTTVGDQQLIVCSSAGSVDGYDPKTGILEWSFTEVRGNTIASPLPIGEGRFLIGASAGRNSEETGSTPRTNGVLELKLEDGKTVPSMLWQAEKATSSFGSPIVHDKCAYWVNSSGVLFCFDADTGKPHYTQRLKESCWATPLGVGNRVYFFGKSGSTTVLKSGAKYEVLAENRLWNVEDQPADKPETEPGKRSDAEFEGPIQYGVAVVNGSLLIRTGNKLYCLRR